MARVEQTARIVESVEEMREMKILFFRRVMVSSFFHRPVPSSL